MEKVVLRFDLQQIWIFCFLWWTDPRESRTQIGIWNFGSNFKISEIRFFFRCRKLWIRAQQQNLLLLLSLLRSNDYQSALITNKQTNEQTDRRKEIKTKSNQSLRFNSSCSLDTWKGEMMIFLLPSLCLLWTRFRPFAVPKNWRNVSLFSFFLKRFRSND